MIRAVLLGLLACQLAQALEVTIKYDAPVLSLSVPVFTRNIGAVIFHYTVKNVEYQGKALMSALGWEYKTKDAMLDGADDVAAYAVLYDVKGDQIMTTQRSSFSLTDVAHTAVLPARRIRGAVIFRDDFNSFSTSSWNYEVSMYGGMNWEFQVYTNDPKNVYARNGNLYLHPTLTVDDPRFDENFLHHGKMDMQTLFGTCTQSANYGCTREGQYGLLPPVMSGKVKSIPTIRYGIVEVRARIPKGDWLWPAIWMLPRDNKYGGWPRSGEIDIMESRGNPGSIGIGTVSSTLHWGPAWDQNKYYLTTGQKHTGSWHDNFHTWRLEWTPDHLTTYVDNQQIMDVRPPGGGFWQKGGFSGSNLWQGHSKMAPFDQDFYMIFNVAVGGTNGFFPDNANYGVQKPWPNSSPHAAEDFWNGRGAWGPTWQGDHVALIVDYVEFRHL